jgi:hypothetical protein
MLILPLLVEQVREQKHFPIVYRKKLARQLARKIACQRNSLISEQTKNNVYKNTKFVAMFAEITSNIIVLFVVATFAVTTNW